VDAAELVHGHLVFLELEIRGALLQPAHQDIVRELILLREAVG